MKRHPIGRLVSDLRKERGLSLRDLEKSSGLGRGLLSGLERDKTPNPCWSTLSAVAKGLRMPLAKFLRELAWVLPD